MELPAPPTQTNAEADRNFKIMFRVGVVLGVLLVVELITGVLFR
jgi:hypothetical protein